MNAQLHDKVRAQPFLSIRDVWKRYGNDTVALKGVSLDVQPGEIVCLVGPSGCGKTTLLRIVAGLETADSGAVLLEGKNLLTLPVHARGFGLMFQEFALFPDKSVAGNIAFGLRMQAQKGDAQALAKSEIAERVEEMLTLVNLRGYGERSIFALSGGERQRVALARSLAPRPRLLMLDEPLGSLDRALRESLMDELRTILKRLGLTAIYVTHDQQEALAIGDRVVVMNKGSIEQDAPPRTVWSAPANEFVARFLGFQNLLSAQVSAEQPAIAHTAIGEVQVEQSAAQGDHVLLVRPDALILEQHDDLKQWQGRLIESSFRGAYQRLEIAVSGKLGEQLFVFHAPADIVLEVGDIITFALDPARCILIPASGDPA